MERESISLIFVGLLNDLISIGVNYLLYEKCTSQRKHVRI
jgi:hypothetical protein